MNVDGAGLNEEESGDIVNVARHFYWQHPEFTGDLEEANGNSPNPPVLSGDDDSLSAL